MPEFCEQCDVSLDDDNRGLSNPELCQDCEDDIEGDFDDRDFDE